MLHAKQEIVSFKLDASLLAAMKSIPNRSQFIRSAILAAMESACPLCGGSGVLSPKQKNHWDRFAESHAVAECRQCHEMHLTCPHDEADPHGNE